MHISKIVALKANLRLGSEAVRQAASNRRAYKSKGIAFVREPKEEEYGTVAVFKDLYGNLWDLLELRAPAAAPAS